MHQSVGHQGVAEFLHLRPESAQQAAGRDLHQAALVDESGHQPRLGQDAQVSFRVREDSHHSGRAEFGQQVFQRHVHFVRQFEQHVLLAVGQREHVASAQAGHHAGFDAHVGARQHG